MWTAAWALNPLAAMGKSTDWLVYMLGQAVGTHTDATIRTKEINCISQTYVNA